MQHMKESKCCKGKKMKMQKLFSMFMLCYDVIWKDIKSRKTKCNVI